jgi:hypothetical protein
MIGPRNIPLYDLDTRHQHIRVFSARFANGWFRCRLEEVNPPIRNGLIARWRKVISFCGAESTKNNAQRSTWLSTLKIVSAVHLQGSSPSAVESSRFFRRKAFSTGDRAKDTPNKYMPFLQCIAMFYGQDRKVPLPAPSLETPSSFPTK